MEHHLASHTCLLRGVLSVPCLAPAACLPAATVLKIREQYHIESTFTGNRTTHTASVGSPPTWPQDPQNPRAQVESSAEPRLHPPSRPKRRGAACLGGGAGRDRGIAGDLAAFIYPKNPPALLLNKNEKMKCNAEDGGIDGHMKL